jgi:hypothetical protein
MRTPANSGTAAAPCRVFVAIPTVHWRLTAQLASFLLRLGSGQLADPRRWSFEIAVLPDVQPVAFARNTLVAAFLQAESSWLWFLDDDMTPTDSTVAVLDVDADIVTGRAPIVRPGDDGEPIIAHAAFASRKGDAFEYAKAAAHPVPIVAAGAGCLLVRRAVLEDPRMRLEGRYESAFGEPRDLAQEAEAAPAIFRTPTKPNGEALIGEDMDFVYRAHLLGYRCMFEPKALLGHHKRVDLAGVERMLNRGFRAEKAGQA